MTPEVKMLWAMERIPDPFDPSGEIVTWSEKSLCERWREINVPVGEVMERGLPEEERRADARGWCSCASRVRCGA